MINEQWIEAFVWVSKTQSVSKAAENLFLTQPSVSTRIQALENEIGEPLFFRTGRKMLLTDAGRTLLPYALDILKNWKNANMAIHQLHNRIQGELTVGLFYNILPIVSPFLISFAEKYPDIKLSIRTGHSDEVQDLVLSYAVQVGLIGNSESMINKSLISKRIISDKFTLAVYPGHRLAHYKNIQIEDLQCERFIYLYAGDLKIKNYFDPHDHNIILVTDSVDLCKKMVISKLGIAFIPRFPMENEIRDGFLIAINVCIPDLQNMMRNIDLIWLQNQSDNSLISLFTQFISSKFSNMS